MEASTGQMKKIAGLQLYNVPEIAKMLGVSTKTVLKLISDGELPGRRIGKGYFVTEQKLKDFIENVEVADDDEDEDDGDVLFDDAVLVEPQGTSEDDTPYLEVTQSGEHRYETGTLLRLTTPYFIVGEDFRLIPLKSNGEGYWDEDKDEIMSMVDDDEDDTDDA